MSTVPVQKGLIDSNLEYKSSCPDHSVLRDKASPLVFLWHFFGLHVHHSNLSIFSKVYFGVTPQWSSSPRRVRWHHNNYVSFLEIPLIPKPLLPGVQTGQPLSQPSMTKMANKFLDSSPTSAGIKTCTVHSVRNKPAAQLPLQKMVGG